jgi:hypothetical protein
MIVHQEGTAIEVARLPISTAQRLTRHRQRLADLSFFRTRWEMQRNVGGPERDGDALPVLVLVPSPGS